MSKPMPPIWWYRSLQKLILDKKNIQNQKNVFVNFFFLVSIFAKHWYNEEKKENYYQQRLKKKTEKTNKLERILKFRLRNENKKKS